LFIKIFFQDNGTDAAKALDAFIGFTLFAVNKTVLPVRFQEGLSWVSPFGNPRVIMTASVFL